MKVLSWILAIALTARLPAAGAPLILGVLEQPQCKDEQKQAGRLLFAKVGKSWIALDHGYSKLKGFNPSLQSWTISLDGHSLGKINLRDQDPATPNPMDWNYGRDKLYEALGSGSLPIRANHSKAFAGWCGTPSLRPLVILSESNVDDPGKWQVFSPEGSYRQRLFASLKRAIGQSKVLHCVGKSEVPKPFKFNPFDLVLYKGYRSAFGREIVSIGIDQKNFKCDGVLGPEWSNHWFLVEGTSIKFIGREMELVDVGDYDRDGQPEFLFWHSGYNQDGYVLMHDHFKQKSEYLWGYH